MSRFIALGWSLWCVLLLCGCNGYRADDPMRGGATAFRKVWLSEEARWEGFDQIFVAPVRTDRLISPWSDPGHERRRADILEERVRGVRQQFIHAFQRDPRHDLEVVESPGATTLVLELAFSELVPKQSRISPQRTRGGGLIKFEALLRQGSGGDAIAAFEDRRRSGQIRSDVSRWARLSVELLADLRAGRIP